MILDNPKVPSDIWYALGLCYYRCGNLPKAKLSFEKTLELDSNNAMAWTSLGILEQALSPNDSSSRKRAVNYFMKAFEVNPRNPLVLKHLADHLFFKNEFTLCREFCKSAQEILKPIVRPEQADRKDFRQEIELLKSNFCFILGKADHLEGNYDSAYEHFQLALKHNNKNYEAHFLNAKCEFQLGNY